MKLLKLEKVHDGEYLKNYARKNGAKYPNPYVRKLIATGDYLDILKGYRRKKEGEKQEETKSEVVIITAEEEEKIREIQKQMHETIKKRRFEK